MVKDYTYGIGLGPREKLVIDLLLLGYDNEDISKELKMAKRTVKAHFARLFLRFGIKGGVKRVKLATLLYRMLKCKEVEENAEIELLRKGTELLSGASLRA